MPLQLARSGEINEHIELALGSLPHYPGLEPLK